MANVRSVERGVHHAILDPQHPLLDRIDQRGIAVDDEIEQRIENIVGAVREIRRQGFKPRPDVGVRACRPMADADEEMRADEEGSYPRLDSIAVEIGGTGVAEQMLAIVYDPGEPVVIKRNLYV